MFRTKNILYFDNGISLQHKTLRTLLKYKDFFNIETNNLFIFCVVRNSYQRIISDLFWFKLINAETLKDEVFNIIKTYLY